jgi:hypothetical protein
MVGLDIESLVAKISEITNEIATFDDKVSDSKKIQVLFRCMPSSLRDTMNNLEKQDKDYEACVDALRGRIRSDRIYDQQFSKTKPGRRQEEHEDAKMMKLEPRGKSTCSFCSKTGHEESTCWKAHPELRPKRENTKGNARSQNGRSENQGQGNSRKNSQVAKGVKCYCCGGKGHKQDVCPSKSSNQEKDAKGVEMKSLKTEDDAEDSHEPEDGAQEPKDDPELLNMNDQVSGEGGILSVQLDSGAQRHATGNRELLVKVRQVPEVNFSGFKDSFKAKSHEVGNMPLKVDLGGKPKTWEVENVYFVEGMPGTLLSAGVFARKGLKIDGDACVDGEAKVLTHKLVFKKTGRVAMEFVQKPNSTAMNRKMWKPSKQSLNTVHADGLDGVPDLFSDDAGAHLNNVSKSGRVGAPVSPPQPVCSDGMGFSCKDGCSRDGAKSTPGNFQATSTARVTTASGGDTARPNNAKQSGRVGAPVSPPQSVCMSELGLSCKSVGSKGVESKTNKAREDSTVKSSTSKSEAKVQNHPMNLQSLLTWHLRLGHASRKTMREFLHASKIKFKDQDELHCDACGLGKLKNGAIPGLSSNVAKEPLERICIDLSGRQRNRSLGGAEYFGVVVDQATGYTHVITVKTKDKFGAEVIKWMKLVERQTGKKIKVLRADNAGEHEEIFKYCKKNGIKVETTVAGHSYQNGLAERMIQELQVQARTMLVSAGAPKSFWAFAVTLAARLYNLLGHRRNNWVGPARMLLDEDERLDLLKPFGCVVYVKDKDASKIEAQGSIGAYLGPSVGKRGVVVWLPREHKVVNSVDFKCDEQRFAWVEATQAGQLRHLLSDFLVDTEKKEEELEEDEPEQGSSAQATSTNAASHQPEHPERASEAKEQSANTDSSAAHGSGDYRNPLTEVMGGDGVQVNMGGDRSNSQAVNAQGTPAVQDDSKEAHGLGDNRNPTQEVMGGMHGQVNTHEVRSNGSVASQPSTQAVPAPRYNLRTNRGVPPLRYEDDPKLNVLELCECAEGKDFVVKLAQAEVDGDKVVPKTHQEAMKGPDAAHWKKAEDEEYESLKAMKSYVAGTPPPGVNVLNSKMVYAIKENERGEIEKYKARLVACGYGQKYQEDYFFTKADVSPVRSFRLVMAIAAAKKMLLTQLDVKSAFLNSKLDEVVWIRTPDGCKERFWRLVKALYGLKQAAHNWRALLDKILRELGLLPCNNDPACYVLKQGDELLVLAVHVDDMLVATTTTTMRDWLVDKLGQKVTLKVEKQPKWLLHMKIEYDRDAGVLKLDQSTYLKEVLAKFDPEGHRTARMPLPDNAYLSPTDKSDLSDGNIHLYQAIVGSLMYAATHTRPDLSFAVGHLGKFLHCPSKVHLDAAFHVLWYVRGTLSYGLVYRSGGARNVVEGWSDANFANELDRHSVGAYVFYLLGNLISWQSRRQKTVSVSTEEAEITAASEATREAYALRGIGVACGILSESDIIPLSVDNSPAVTAIQNPGYYGRLKHLDIQHKFVMEAHQQHIVSVKWCSTVNMLADCLTKPTNGKKLVEFYQSVMSNGNSRST